MNYRDAAFFATQGFTGIMNIWAMIDEVGGVKATGDDVRKGFKNTKDHHAYGGTGISCKDAIKPYIAVCATLVSASVWNGTALTLKAKTPSAQRTNRISAMVRSIEGLRCVRPARAR